MISRSDHTWPCRLVPLPRPARCHGPVVSPSSPWEVQTSSLSSGLQGNRDNRHFRTLSPLCHCFVWSLPPPWKVAPCPFPFDRSVHRGGRGPGASRGGTVCPWAGLGWAGALALADAPTMWQVRLGRREPRVSATASRTSVFRVHFHLIWGLCLKKVSKAMVWGQGGILGSLEAEIIQPSMLPSKQTGLPHAEGSVVSGLAGQWQGPCHISPAARGAPCPPAHFSALCPPPLEFKRGRKRQELETGSAPSKAFPIREAVRMPGPRKGLDFLGIKNKKRKPWLVWLSGLSAGPRTKESPVQFQGACLGRRPGPHTPGRVRKATTH